MLTIDDDGLTFRSITIPWRMVADLTNIRIARMDYLGIVPSDDGKEYVTSDLEEKPLHRQAFRNFMKGHGALLVPPARNATAQQLRAILSQYREERIGISPL